MKILGIDTSTMAANVAVLEDDKLICEYTINTKKTHSQKLRYRCYRYMCWAWFFYRT